MQVDVEIREGADHAASGVTLQQAEPGEDLHVSSWTRLTSRPTRRASSRTAIRPCLCSACTRASATLGEPREQGTGRLEVQPFTLVAVRTAGSRACGPQS